MDVDGAAPAAETSLEEDLPTCQSSPRPSDSRADRAVDASIEAPPSVLPQRKYCDITGLEVWFIAS